MRITLEDDREMIGQLLAFDKFMNLVLADTEEFRRPNPKKRRKSKSKSKKKEDRIFKRALGLMIIRGEVIISVSVEAPPPPEETRNRLAPTLVGPLPGIGRAAGRGMAMAPPALGRATNLSGPPKGLGGPAPGMMIPRGALPPGGPPQGYRGPLPPARGPPGGPPGGPGRPHQGYRGGPPGGVPNRGPPPGQGFRGGPFRGPPPPGMTRPPPAPMSLPPGIVPPGRGN